MVDVPVYNIAGEQTGTMQIDEAILGGRLRPKLMKQAVVAHLAAQRQGSARTRSRGMVAGSTRKLYRQKGTGNARTGAIRSPVKTGGGVTFAKTARDFRHAMPKKARRLARNSAILARIQGNDALILDPFEMTVPKTRELAKTLASVGAGTGCVLALGQPSDAVYKSGRNLQKIEVRLVGDLCAYDVLRRKKLVFTKSAFELLLANPVSLRAAEQAEE